MDIIRNGEDHYEINIDKNHSVFIKRQLFGKTKYDLEVENLPIPSDPLWLKYLILLIRGYQRNISPKLGNRCVFDPSCSRYSEQAFRTKGFIYGLILTYKRLIRCRPRNGGIDLLP